MVQVISLDKLTPQILDKIDTKDVKLTNTDFLELLLKDMKDSKEDDIQDSLNIVEKEDNSLDSEVDEKDLKLEPKLQQLSIKNLTTSDEKDKTSKLEEIKNIITSNFKQENILLSKQEVKEFKSIDNLKDLIKFADKKGLNIEKLQFDVEKDINLETKPKEVFNNLDKPKNLTQVEKHKFNNIKSNKIADKTQKETILSLEDIINIKSKDKSKTTTNISNIKKSNDKHITTIQKKEQKIVLNEKTDTILKLKENKDSRLENKPKEKNIDLVNKVIKKDKENKEIKTDSKKISLETLLDKKVDSKNIEKTSKTNNIDLESLLNQKEEIKPKEKKIDTQNTINLNQQTMVNELKAKSVQAKETISHFQNNLDEAIKNYKPPVSKVNIELNPQNLGKVEVIIVQRGNNIQVNMNTDQSNVMLFQNHQAEFRQALANIGFSNIDMSFNSNQDRDRRQNQAKKTYKENENIDIDKIGDIEVRATYKYA